MVKVYFGPDTGYSYHIASKDLKKSLNALDFGKVERLDGYKDSVSYIVESCQTISLFCPHKTILVSNAYFFTDTKNKKGSLKESDQNYPVLEDYLMNPSPETDLYFVVPGPISRTGSPNKALSSPAVTLVSCDIPTDEDYVMLAFRRAKEEKKEIDKDAADLLLKRTKGDYLSFSNNLDKLFCYTDHVMKVDVEEMVYRPLEDNVFSIVSYLMKGKTNEAVRAYEELKKNGTDILSLLPIFASQFNRMALVKYMTASGYPKDAIVKELRVSPGMLYYTQRDVRNIPMYVFINAMSGLFEVEKNIKINLDDTDTRMESYLLLFSRNYLRGIL